ncbi:MAG: family 43 glycosylhydrolase [Spirochaetales bacterium]|nr:family 43 glycosylhydrolase [Spirochaetales bacterium]
MILNGNLFPELGLTDPHVLIEGDKLYLYCGHDKSMETENEWIMDRWEVWSTSDLVRWNRETTILPTDTYIGNQPNCWAGDIASKDGKWYWYFSNKNINIGVMTASSPAGPFIDPLGIPLIPEDLVDSPVYDCDVVEERGRHYLIFGCNRYYAVPLAGDLISLDGPPVEIKVRGTDRLDDKPCPFKRDGKYYLVWGSHYAMADSLLGPYEYKGPFLKGGHGDVFNWKGKWYCMQENLDVSLFFRGMSLKTIEFNVDGTIIVPDDDENYPPGGRIWDFSRSALGWRALKGTTLQWNTDGCLEGRLDGKEDPLIISPSYPITNLDKYKNVSILMDYSGDGTEGLLAFQSWNGSWDNYKEVEPFITEDNSVAFSIPYGNNKEIRINMSGNSGWTGSLKRLLIKPAIGSRSGTWRIRSISIS